MGFRDIRFIWLFLSVFYCFTLSKNGYDEHSAEQTKCWGAVGIQASGGSGLPPAAHDKKGKWLTDPGMGGVGGRHLLYTWIWDVLRKFNWVYFRIFCLIFLFKSKCFMLYKSLWKFLSSACSHCFTDCKKPQQQYLTFLKKFLRTREQLYVRSAFSISDCAWA